MKQRHTVSMKYRTVLLFMVIAIGVGSLAGCVQSNQPDQNAPNSTSSGKISSPLHAQLSINGTPSLNQPVELALTFYSSIDAPNTVAQILPAKRV